ncbi:MAG: 2-amino-4-hydroxy-6-hydroxymethyldihydropteridine diphosphokinase [Casimicrobiaceae bacterium]
MSLVQRPSMTACVALGSNLGDRAAHLRAARHAIAALEGVHILATSSMYESAAEGTDEPQPNYLNAVVALATPRDVHDLWRELFRLESQLGRTRPAGQRNASRTIDIDLLSYGDQAVTTEHLILPHPRLFSRPFVVIPLLEIGIEQINGCALRDLPSADPKRVTRVGEIW